MIGTTKTAELLGSLVYIMSPKTTDKIFYASTWTSPRTSSTTMILAVPATEKSLLA
jgi:hypothetical protein